MNTLLPVFPLIFHSIPDEIPEPSRPLITRLYQLWLVLFATLIVNLVAAIFIFATGGNQAGGDLGGSIGSVGPLSLVTGFTSIVFSSAMSSSSQSPPSSSGTGTYSPPLSPFHSLSYPQLFRPIYNGYMKVSVLYTLTKIRLSSDRL